jgi:hypothetical protein
MVYPAVLRRPSRKAASRAEVAVLAGMILTLTLTVGLRLPLLAAMQAGPWPVVAGCAVGSATLSGWHTWGRRPARTARKSAPPALGLRLRRE